MLCNNNQPKEDIRPGNNSIQLLRQTSFLNNFNDFSIPNKTNLINSKICQNEPSLNEITCLQSLSDKSKNNPSDQKLHLANKNSKNPYSFPKKPKLCFDFKKKMIKKLCFGIDNNDPVPILEKYKNNPQKNKLQSAEKKNK